VSDAKEPGEIMNLQEAAAYLGVSTKTFQKVLREGDVPGRKVGREWKFSRRALSAWVGRGLSAEYLDTDENHINGQGRMPPPRKLLRSNDREFSAEED
jgi:excisionase family DNA binding protein